MGGTGHRVITPPLLAGMNVGGEREGEREEGERERDNRL